MEEKVKTMQEKVKILTLEEKVKTLEEKVKILTLEEKVKTLEEKVKTLTLEEKVKTLEEKVKTLEEKVENLQKENKECRVAFSASLFTSGSGHMGPFKGVEPTIIYKKVHTNFGNGYNSETGIFTVPVRGVYFLRMYAHSHTGVRMAVRLTKNGEDQCSVYSHMPSSTNGNASNGIVLSLEKGDEIYTKLWDNSWVYDDPNRYTSFGGFLLFPL
ncbi:complement component 1, q subcomponent-like 4 like [Trichomycterus rosablanca]|uniref:complement component 1, q subcomponent-like 4 like n=1 Tax=Trichomycterus rosablanca TaxID=2290929 RepID=UPI002F35978D